MANSLLTISMITKESLRVLANNLTFAGNINRQYDDQFAKSGAKIGDTINIRKPARYVGRLGTTLSVEDHTETSAPLQLNTQFGVDVNFTSKDLALSLDEFSDRFVKPAMAVVANKIDRDGLALYKDIFNSVGTPGTVPTTFRTYLQAGAKMDYSLAPRDDNRMVCIDPGAQLELIDTLKGLFQDGTSISQQYKKGVMGIAGGFKFAMDQNINTHTIGALGGTPVVNGAGQVGSVLVTNGWTASIIGILKRGDIFTIPGVFQVNAQSRQPTANLQQFVVTADCTSDVSGNVSIPVYPAITVSGAFQTVVASPAAGATITMFGAAGALSPAHLAYHKDAFVLGCADLQLPGGVDMASRVSDPTTGLSIRMVRQYDIVNDKFPCRLDVLYGYKTVYPELACRIQG